VSRLQLLLRRLRASEAATGVILAILVGLLAGLGAVVFRWMIRGFHNFFFDGGERALGFLDQYYVILIPAAGGLVVGLLIHFLAREARGHGVPEVMEAVAVKDGRIRQRVAIVKALASSVCIGSGGSVGREGPIVQIGSSVGSTLGQWFRLPGDWLRTLVACGAAGAISATFNAPIGGIFFALEVILGRVMVRSFGFIVISSVVADFTAHIFLADEPSFSLKTPYEMASYWEILPYVLLGILAAFIAVGFIRLLYKTEDIFDLWKIPAYLKPAFGGILIGVIGLYGYGLFGLGNGLFGVGYGYADSPVDLALASNIGLGMLFAMLFLKMLATSITIGSGGSGGVFAPSLFIGSMLGGAFGEVTHRLFPAITAPSGAYALVGMGAVFAGAARAPITAIIMLFEMTRDYTLILPLMLAVVISTLVARNLGRESIYTLKLVRRGIDIHRREEADILGAISVNEVMTRDFPTILPSMSVSELINELHQSGHHGFPMVDERGRFCGCVALEDVEAAMSRRDPTLTAGDIATKSPIVAYPDQSIRDALAQFGGRDVGRIPVVDRNNPQKLVGILRRHDIVRAYTRAVGNQVVE